MFLCYVILHYMEADATVECIDSIIRTAKEDYRIIVVDNASNNGSYEYLLKHYEGEDKIEWIKNDNNIGFAAGNNVGYRYAKQKYYPEYILIGNNDLVFVQEDFDENLKELGKEYSFYIAGPDIENLKGEHQNPYRFALRPTDVLKKKNRNKKVILNILKLKKRFSFLQGINIVEEFYFKDGKRTIESKWIDEVMKNIVLHGSCLIFSQKYMQNHDDAFPEYTFLYMEEEILKLRCEKLGYDTYYFPQLKVLHKEDVSTDSIVKNELDKRIFLLTESTRSVDAYLQLVEKDVI